MRFALGMAIAAASALLLGPITTTAADAGCTHCKPASRTVVKTNYRVNTVQQVNHVTRYRDVAQVRDVVQYRDVVRPNYVNVVHRTVDVTRVVPVTHVNVVTRVHPVTRVNTVTRVRDVTVFQHSRETVGHTVTTGGRTVYGHGAVMMPARVVSGGSSAVHIRGGARHIDCGC